MIMTYEQMAEAMGITLATARREARRKRWMRTRGNDGKARVDVPDEFLESRKRPQDSPEGTPEGAPQDSHEGLAIALARAEAQVGVLGELVEAERRRAEAAERDRDLWHALATRPRRWFWQRSA